MITIIGMIIAVYAITRLLLLSYFLPNRTSRQGFLPATSEEWSVTVISLVGTVLVFLLLCCLMTQSASM